MNNFDLYLKSLQSQNISEITEHSHRSSLQQLLESLAGAKIKILHEPKREGKFGSPDFKVTYTESIIGYIENKKIEENLDRIIKTEQIKKYKSLSNNILLTNYIEWIWIKEGIIQKRETLCFLSDIENKRAKLDKLKAEAVEKLIKSFFSQAPKKIGDAKELAAALAIRAKLLKDFLLDELKRQEKEHTEGRLYQLFETFKNFVFHELTVDEFSDAFSQNLVYGLFLAKLNADAHSVNLYNAKKYIPASFELIKELVNFLDELDNDEYREARWIVEEVLTIMNNLDLWAIQKSLSFTKKRKNSDNLIVKDPYVYFYEDFLAAYDKKLRKAKGVYYTPPPVVNFIVRAIDDILVNTFKIKDGLADRNKVTVLDFATGTGTFLVEVLQQIFEKFPKDSGKKDLIIKEHILKNIFGFEYLIAPYTIAHLKLSQYLKEQNYDLKAKERFNIYLTNTLEPADKQVKIPLLPALTEETQKAQVVKDNPILVITGNPPYSSSSSNIHTAIIKLLEDYKRGLNEKKLNLDDDYIKFIRFAHHKMENVEKGIIAIITNNSFYDGINHRKMRESLLETFDKIYILNLHGNSRIKEKAPNGSIDENVFDIIVGTGITILIKDKTVKQKEIFYDDIFGDRISKYKELFSSDLGREWIKIKPLGPHFLFKPQSPANNIYDNFINIKEIFEINGSCVKTERDNVTIHFNKQSLEKLIKDFLSLTESELKAKYSIYDSRDWKVSAAKQELVGLADDYENYYQDLLYRPFDKRVTLYTGKSKAFIGTPGYKLNKHMLKPNIGLLLGRSGNVVEQNVPWNLSFITKSICDTNIFYRGGAILFPLYRYNENGDREINFTYQFIKFTSEIGPGEEVMTLGYIYAILYSPTYRNRYNELLKIDFPKIPFTNDLKAFKQLAALGNKLINVHLLDEEVDYPYGEFIGKGNNIVEKYSYVPKNKSGKIYINKTQYFENVPIDVWNFYIGGYQVIDKYLKDHKERKLSYDEVDNIASTIKALAFTIEQMKKIDKLTMDWI